MRKSPRAVADEDDVTPGSAVAVVMAAIVVVGGVAASGINLVSHSSSSPSPPPPKKNAGRKVITLRKATWCVTQLQSYATRIKGTTATCLLRINRLAY